MCIVITGDGQITNHIFNSNSDLSTSGFKSNCHFLQISNLSSYLKSNQESYVYRFSVESRDSDLMARYVKYSRQNHSLVESQYLQCQSLR